MAENNNPYKLNLPRVLMAVAIMSSLIGGSYLLFFGSDSSDSGTAKVNKMGRVVSSIPREKSIGGNEGTPDIQERVQNMNTAQGVLAVRAGKNHIPMLPVGKAPEPVQEVTSQPVKARPLTSAPPKMSTPLTPPKLKARPVAQRPLRESGGDLHVEEAIRRLRDGMRLGDPELVVAKVEKTKTQTTIRSKKQITSQSAKAKKDESGKQKDPILQFLKPGEFLYCVNELDVDSDSPKDDVLLRVVAPAELNGAKVFGKFARFEEKLLIEVHQVVHKDTIYPVRGLAINPKDASVNVATSVDTHFWERYGAMFLATLAEGAADLIMMSGTTSTISNGVVTNTKDKVTVGEVGVAAAGNTGRRMVGSLEKNMNLPPTVKLGLGKEVAVVLLEVN